MIRLALFEDNQLLRETFSDILSEAEDIYFIGAWENGEMIEEIVRLNRPDVILMDIDMPVVNGLETLKIVTKKFPAVHVIMLTIFEDDLSIMESIYNGAKGYLLKKSTPEEILYAVKDIMEGGSPMTSSIARKVLNAIVSQKPNQTEDYKLTAREKDILRSLVDGNSYKLIAADLGISINTVRQYIRSIYEKLQVHSMNEAVSKALRNKIV